MATISSFTQIKDNALSEFKSILLQEYPSQIDHFEITTHSFRLNERSDIDIEVFINQWCPQIDREVDDLACDLLLRQGVLVSPVIIDHESANLIED